MADGKPASIRCKSCNGKMPRRRLSGVNHPMWRGGRYIRNDGYLWVKLLGVNKKYQSMADMNGYVAEHRLVMAKQLERCLHSNEVVHHINGIKLDNQMENLELVTRKFHNAMGYKLGYKRGYEDGFKEGLSTARGLS